MYEQDYFRPFIGQNFQKMAYKFDHFLSYGAGYKDHPTNILDFGCGGGTLCAYLKQRYRNVRIVGVDKYQVPIDAAIRDFGDLGIDFRCLDIKSLKAPNEGFDLIVSHEVVEHLEQPDEDFRSLHSLLSPGGLLLLKTPNGLDLDRALSKFTGRVWYADEDPTHINYFTPFNLKLALSRAGFKGVRCFTGTQGYFVFGREIPSLPWIGHGLVAVATKGL